MKTRRKEFILQIQKIASLRGLGEGVDISNFGNEWNLKLKTKEL